MNGDGRGGWYDESAGPLVRPYAITNGRTSSGTAPLDLSTQVMALRSGQEPTGVSPEHLEVMRLSRTPMSIAEIAAHLQLPLGVVRVIVGDLIGRGLVITRSPSQRPADRPDLETLQAVYDALLKL
ncbi:DUF742 domain-containing protein [Pseudonocardia sp. CA-142604]|uniref:DUF742 domain-containing protein n=1 Tax=Pseudonocardia sp. CA-142604 TaxID=3240024 RepID=UPI003D8F2486